MKTECEGSDLQASATPAPDLDRLFAPQSRGYMGADAALSIPLGNSRTIWLFGDTLIGQMTKGIRRIQAMPRNTAALQHPGPQTPESIEWFLGTNDTPRDFLRLPETEHGKWFWPGTGICLNGQLFVFGYGVVYQKGEWEALSFRPVDGWMMRVPDTSGSPADWKIHAQRMPCPIGDTWLGSACYTDPPWLYLIGVSRRRDPLLGDSSTVLARIQIESLLETRKPLTFEFWNSTQDGGTWNSLPGDLQTLYRPGVSEASIFFDAPRRRFIATTYYATRPDFFLTFAPTLTGPWTPPATILRVDDSKPPDGPLSYTLRIHPHLASNPDELVVTHVVNPRTLDQLVRQPDLYYPRFHRIDLTQTG
jgi:hypothetical protein